MNAPESHLDFYKRWNQLSKPYIQWQFEQFKPYLGRRVADVGCALGNFTPLLFDRELYLGVEPDPVLLEEFQKRFRPHANVRVIGLDASKSDLRKALENERIDSILCVNVLEHIEQDRAALEGMIAALPSGGVVCLLVPAMPLLFGTLDSLDGHYRRYTKKSMCRLCESLPAEMLELKYFNFAAAPGWFLKGRILRQSRHTNDNYHLMNMVLPVVRQIEKRVPPPFGLSLITVLRKK